MSDAEGESGRNGGLLEPPSRPERHDVPSRSPGEASIEFPRRKANRWPRFPSNFPDRQAGTASAQPAIAETADFYRLDASSRLDPKRRSELGQYMTPAPIGRFMAGLFENLSGDLNVLDPGAGVGSLSAAFVERCCREPSGPKTVSLHCHEIEPVLVDYLETTLRAAEKQGGMAGIGVTGEIRADDFILATATGRQGDMFDPAGTGDETFSHVIMNPPYRKIGSASKHRAALRKAGIETSNLYTGFTYLAASRLTPGGEMVAIVPRSFSNGPYFKLFREKFFAMMTLRHVHVFDRRDSAFKGDEVLQENVIIHAVKDAAPSTVTITASTGGAFEFDAASGQSVGEDMTRRTVAHESMMRPDDPAGFLHIAANGIEQGVADRMARFSATLDDLGLEVSTGPVIDFRLREDLRAKPDDDTVPLLYATHFQGGRLEWPKETKKPNAIAVTETSRKWLYPNEGHFVVTRRFTSKEEKRRVVASVYAGDLPGELVGFENHLNVFHARRKGVSRSLAAGVAIYLNSNLVDRYFRQFNGHTQVNAADLRSLRYPDRKTLERVGGKVRESPLPQREIDELVEKELARMTDDENPLDAQRKIDEALEIVKALGLPRGQWNERSALTLLALLDLKPDDRWSALRRPLMGITPIMEYCHERYGRKYAPNTRETFRRRTMHQFVQSGTALRNPDEPDRPVNSPKVRYQISEEAAAVIRTFGTDAWRSALGAWLSNRQTLADKWAKRRKMRKIPVRMPEGEEVALTPGDHSEPIKRIIEEFAPRFAPASEVVLVGDAGDKNAHFRKDRLAELGVILDRHGKMPDVVLHFVERNWLVLVEAVSSHGPIDPKRHDELAKLFAEATPGLVYVTAFPDRSVMARHLREISWETEVWCADAPSHLIHFDGQRLLGPHEERH